jgi:hypothetical protein
MTLSYGSIATSIPVWLGGEADGSTKDVQRWSRCEPAGSAFMLVHGRQIAATHYVSDAKQRSLAREGNG